MINFDGPDWRPIASAPKDGTLIWVADPDCGAFVMRWEPDRTNLLFSDAKGMWVASDDSLTWCEDTGAGPTRWKPYLQ